MITYDDIISCQECLVQNWGEAGKRVIAACVSSTPFNNTFEEFLNYCTACGGNWGGMLLTGINELWPNVYREIPDDMGALAWACICNTLVLLGVDTSE